MAASSRPATIESMASFLVETYIRQGDRDGFANAVVGLRSALETANGLDGPVRYVRSYLVPSDEMGVHVVESDSAEAVKRLAKVAGIEVERIVSAVGVDPGRAQAPPLASDTE
jgi:hypothetical protein